MPTTASAPRRARLRRAAAGTVLVAGLLGAAACSTPAPSEEDLAAALMTSGISKKVSECTADALAKSLTPSELAEITERGAGGAPVDDPKQTDESADKLVAAMARCRDLQVAETPSTTIPIPDDDGANAGAVTTIADGTQGAELNPASTTTTAAATTP
ncbi:MAG: hypothetical protein JWO77_1799 [Ilumatobacteraceae bacterium]|nr:hypothetical protein [Ilumatobacteraceae bacterium]